jgi:3-carboxy-cis,cis-muconate cycloisomerase
VVNEHGGTLAEALAVEPEVTKHFDAAAIARMTDAANYAGLAPQMVDRVIGSVKR